MVYRRFNIFLKLQFISNLILILIIFSDLFKFQNLDFLSFSQFFHKIFFKNLSKKWIKNKNKIYIYIIGQIICDKYYLEKVFKKQDISCFVAVTCGLIGSQNVYFR